MNSQIAPPPSLLHSSFLNPPEPNHPKIFLDDSREKELNRKNFDKKLKTNEISKNPTFSKELEDRKLQRNSFFGDLQKSENINKVDFQSKNIENSIEKSSNPHEKTKKKGMEIEIGSLPKENFGPAHERKRINELFDDPENLKEFKEMGSQSKNFGSPKIVKLSSPHNMNKMDFSEKFESSLEIEERMVIDGGIPDELKSPNPILKYLRNSMNRSISIHKSIRRLGSKEDEEEKGEGGDLLKELIRNANREEVYEIKSVYFIF